MKIDKITKKDVQITNKMDRFEQGFVNTLNNGSAFTLKRPLNKELTNQLKIINNRYEVSKVYTSFSKELTIGLLD